MSDNQTVIAEISEAMHEQNLEKLKALFSSNPTMLKYENPLIATWLHWACRTSGIDIVKFLVEAGLDINKPDNDNFQKPICVAAYEGNADIVEYLISMGAELDDSSSLSNPLFAAVVGRSIDVANLLIQHGANGKKRYTSETMTDMNALAFAVMRGELEIAERIAICNAENDSELAASLINEARNIAEKNVG